LVRLWREKRGEAEAQDYSGNLIVQLGVATEPLNRLWYQRTTGQVLKDVQTWVRHPVIRWMAATLDGIFEGTGAVFEAKFMLPWFSEEAAAEKHMAQVQHDMWVTNATAEAVRVATRESGPSSIARGDAGWGLGEKCALECALLSRAGTRTIALGQRSRLHNRSAKQSQTCIDHAVPSG
jgi:hypothetical protein